MSGEEVSKVEEKVTAMDIQVRRCDEMYESWPLLNPNFTADVFYVNQEEDPEAAAKKKAEREAKKAAKAAEKARKEAAKAAAKVH